MGRFSAAPSAAFDFFDLARDSSFRFIVSPFLLKIYFCGSPQLDHKVNFALDRGISLLIIPKTPKESNMLAAHHLPEIPRS